MLQIEIVNRIGILTLNRPEKRNAFNAELVQNINDAVENFNRSNDVRAILIKANGEAFSAGADLAYLQQLRKNTLDENEQDSLLLSQMFSNIYNSPKLTFTLVNGYALAGGCGLATVADFCFASPSSKFGYTEVRIGFIPAIVLTFLARKVSGTDLNKLVLSGEIFGAQKALGMGLISEVIEDEDFEATALQRIADMIKSTSPNAISNTKELMRKVASMDMDAALKLASVYNAHSRASADCIRGVDAFLNKTKVIW